MIQIKVNGESHSVDADPEMPVLWILRDLLGMTGTKFGCGMGLCGSCTVLLDGQAIRSCITPASAAAGSEITTIEGLSPGGDHPLQKAWRELNVPQCGYCQPGQIMNAAGMLRNTPKPDKGKIRSEMSGNICRCGTYQRVASAIEKASES